MKLKDWASFLSFFLRNPCMKSASSKSAGRGAQCAPIGMPTLLKNTSTKYSKYVVSQNIEHVDDNRFRELFGRIRVLCYKIRYVPS